MVLSSWHCHCKSSPGSCDQCRTAPGGHRPFDQADQLEPQICLNWQLQYYIHHHSLLLLTPKADTYFTITRRAEGWVDLVVGYVLRWFTCLQTHSHPGTKRAQCGATSLVKTNMLPTALHSSAVQSQNTVTREVVILQEKQKTNFVHCILYGTVSVHVSVCFCY